MAFYDLSVPLSADLPTYPGDPGIEITDWSSLQAGALANVSCLRFGAHTGTHVDAPAHFIPGANKLETLALDVLIGEADVVEVPKEAMLIDDSFVSQHCRPGCKRVLFKTRNSEFWPNTDAQFRSDFTSLSLEAAQWLGSQGTQLCGIDYLSIEKFGSKDHAVHLALLERGIVIVEGLDLRAVPPGTYELICLPLRIRGGLGDGSPARAVLRTKD